MHIPGTNIRNVPALSGGFSRISEFIDFKPVALEWTKSENMMMGYKAIMKSVSEIFALLGCYAEQVRNRLPGFGTVCKSHL